MNFATQTSSAWWEDAIPSRRVLILANFVVCCATLVSLLMTEQGRAQEFFLTPGFGHDRFTETFYLEDSTALDPDSLEEIKRTEEGLRESYASLGLGLDHQRWRLESTVYATDAAWRSISEGWARLESERFRVDLRARLEWKGIDSDDSLASAYTYGRIEARPKFELTDSWSAVVAGDWELGDYGQNASYTVDFSRLRGQVGIEYLGPMLEFFDVRIGAASRTVPDSSRLQYTEWFLRVGASGWRTGNAIWSFDLTAADREFDSANAEDNHQRVWMSVRSDYSLGRSWRLEAIGETQYWNYDTDGFVNYDFVNWRLGTGAHYVANPNWEIGAEAEFRFERTASDEEGDSGYDQWRAGPRVSWSPGTTVWIEMTPRIGFRSYNESSAYYDSYSFWEIAAQADVLIGSGPTASVLVSYLSEEHEAEANDLGQLFLSLVARFPLRP